MVKPAARSLLPVLLSALGALATASPLGAQSFPSGMIRIVNGNAAGTPPDIVSRVVANDLSDSEHWYVVVENKVGFAPINFGTAEAPAALQRAPAGDLLAARAAE